MTKINLTSTSGSGFLETDYNQLKGALQSGTYNLYSITADALITSAGINVDTLATSVGLKANKLLSVGSITGAYTLASSDSSSYMRNVGANTITLPVNLSTGFNVTVQNTDGSTITWASDGTINAKNTAQSTQWGAVTAICTAASTWDLIGDL